MNDFQDFTKNKLPEIEKRLEVDQLGKLYETLDSDLLKQELVNSFKRREYDLKYRQDQNRIDKEVHKDPEVEMEYYKDHLA